MDEAEGRRLYEAVINERDPDRLRDAARRLNQILRERIESLEHHPTHKQDRWTGLPVQHLSAWFLSCVLLPNTSTSKIPSGLRWSRAH